MTVTEREDALWNISRFYFHRLLLYPELFRRIKRELRNKMKN